MLEGKTAVIYGGAGAIGGAVARAFADAGATVHAVPGAGKRTCSTRRRCARTRRRSRAASTSRFNAASFTYRDGSARRPHGRRAHAPDRGLPALEPERRQSRRARSMTPGRRAADAARPPAPASRGPGTSASARRARRSSSSRSGSRPSSGRAASAPSACARTAHRRTRTAPTPREVFAPLAAAWRA